MAQEQTLAGKTAYVAGASSGINLGIAKRFKAAGANVVIISRSEEKIAAAAKEVGDGCIGIAAGLHFDGAAVDLADISPAALAVARRNVSLHAVEESVRVIESDLFAGLGGERYELILCNPPYVDAAEMTALPAEFRHEPRLGLAAGADGLDLVRRILQEARAHLSDDGMLVLEVLC
jgi:HemK-like putative methylase